MTKQTKTNRPAVYQLPNGNWKHIKSNIEWAEKCGAETDYRFSCEWEKK